MTIEKRKLDTSTCTRVKSSRRKIIASIHSENKAHGLERTLTATQLTMLGVGSTVGAGIYVMIGSAAAEFAGPSIIISFVLAALACLFTALSYAELSSSLPISGSAYAYAYFSMGERVAWAVGWLLLLEYGISCAAVATGLSAYATNILESFGIIIPQALSHSTFQTVAGSAGMAITFGFRINVVAALAIAAVTFCLVRGARTSAVVNTVIVFLKIGVLCIFVAFGIFEFNPDHWHPFIPSYQGGFQYGIPGILRASSVIFFAYVGFETISTASAEARNPKRDVPVSIVSSLIICTVVYICVATVLIGIVPYQDLDVADPIAVAVRVMKCAWLAPLVNIGATVGLCSVLIGFLYGQTRIFFAMSRDGLLPPVFSKLHPRFRTPWLGTILLGVFVSLLSAFLPVEVITELVSIGTTAAFAAVCVTLMRHRGLHPDMTAGYRVPFGGVRIRNTWVGVTPFLGILFCVIMVTPLFADIWRALHKHNPLPALLLLAYVAAGFVIYWFYSRHHSRVALEEAPLPLKETGT